jgi:hypothetical protein
METTPMIPFTQPPKEHEEPEGPSSCPVCGGPTVPVRGLLLEQVPNVGPAVAADLRLLGVAKPADLVGRDPYAMYEELCRVTGKRHDPCLLDTFIAAVRFMGGEPAKPWWAFTAELKSKMKERQRGFLAPAADLIASCPRPPSRTRPPACR